MSHHKQTGPAAVHPVTPTTVWDRIRCEAAEAAAGEPVLGSFLTSTILHHERFDRALSYRLAAKISDDEMNALMWREVAEGCVGADLDRNGPTAREVSALVARPQL